ncbi:hypothetical protein HanIR_Chr14g0720361 [Helianthus annuus]|nr:hypothetical protein HanIR_Chr14g0720361 [Helianthus annuus]
MPISTYLPNQIMSQSLFDLSCKVYIILLHKNNTFVRCYNLNNVKDNHPIN